MTQEVKSVQGPFINIVPADNGGCGYYRMIQQGNMLQLLNRDVVISPWGKWRAIGQEITYTQRITTQDMQEKLIKWKEQSRQKLIVDFDDLIWEYKGEGLPDYNLCRLKIDTKANTEGLKKNLDKLADKVTCSTDTLKDSLSEFVDPSKITVIPNMLNYKEWYFPQTRRPDEDIFYYAGSWTHYDNINKKPGDFDKNLIHFLANKKVIVKSTVPYFLKPIKNYPATRLTTYATAFYQETRNVKFILAPLADNVFNTCKSDLKYLESAAVGRVCLCSDFPGSPYSGAHPYQKIPVGSTSKAIQFIVDRASEHYDEILKWQWDYLNKRWLDNSIQQYIDILQ